MKSKRILSYITVCVTLLCLCSCQNGDESAPSGTDGTTGDGTLTVYYAKGDPRIELAVSTFEEEHPNIELTETIFDTPQQMDDQLSTELSAGSGPDVVFLNSETTLDIYRSARGGAFADLGALIEADEEFSEDQYFPGVLDAGKIDGKQYFLPATMKIPTVFCQKGESSETGIWDLNSFISAVEESAEQRKNESSKSSLLFRSEDPVFTQMLRLYGVNFVSEDGKEVQIDEEMLQTVAETSKLLLAEQNKSNEMVSTYANDFSAITSRVDYMLWDGTDLPYDVWGYQSLYSSGGGELELAALSDENGAPLARIDLFGAVTSGAAGNTEAYELVKSLAESSGSSAGQVVYGMPVVKFNFVTSINVFSGKEGGSNIGGNQMSVRPVSAENSQKLNTIAESLQTFSLPNGRLLEMAEESFVPYFSDTSSYEDCLAEFRQKMELYIHE